MKLKIPSTFKDFLKTIELNGLIEQAVINFRKDSITASINNNMTMFIYSKMKYDLGEDLELPEVEVIYNRNRDKQIEEKVNIGIGNLSLLNRIFSSLKEDDDKCINAELIIVKDNEKKKNLKKILSEEEDDDKSCIVNLTDEFINSFSLYDKNSTYKLNATHHTVIKEIVEMGKMEYDIEFDLDKDKVENILKGMSNIESSIFYIQNDADGCRIIVGDESKMNSYSEDVEVEDKDDIILKQYFDKEHINAILSVNKGKDITVSINKKLMNIHVEDEDLLEVDYFVVQRHDTSIEDDSNDDEE